MSNNDLFNNEELQKKLLKLDDIVFVKFVPENNCYISESDILAWMPLPTPYQMGGEE